ncbi:hypothetical protein CVN56_06570 [Rhodococcus sp. AQ5-07]|nr:hypothetical protein CVN56_06570 [Rhodococcus sp. AQ5-07]
MIARNLANLGITQGGADSMKTRSRNHMIISSPQHDNRHRADCDLFECIDEIRSPREVARLPHSMGVA